MITIFCSYRNHHLNPGKTTTTDSCMQVVINIMFNQKMMMMMSIIKHHHQHRHFQKPTRIWAVKERKVYRFCHLVCGTHTKNIFWHWNSFAYFTCTGETNHDFSDKTRRNSKEKETRNFLWKNSFKILNKPQPL